VLPERPGPDDTHVRDLGREDTRVRDPGPDHITCTSLATREGPPRLPRHGRLRGRVGIAEELPAELKAYLARLAQRPAYQRAVERTGA